MDVVTPTLMKIGFMVTVIMLMVVVLIWAGRRMSERSAVAVPGSERNENAAAGTT